MTRRAWSEEELAALERAVQRAPSVHNSQPWEFGAEDRRARLVLRPELRVERHDPGSRDQFLSFGAALANLVLAVRNLGWSAEVAFEHDWAATVTAGRRQEPTAAEVRRYNAIPRRATYRRDFADVPVEHLQREAVLGAAGAPGVRPMWVVGPQRAQELASQLVYAARVYSADTTYQRELSAWTFPQDDPEGPVEEAGMPTSALAEKGLAAIGLARQRTRLPTAESLATRIERESVMVLATAFDEPADHVRAGEAMEMAWLAATAQGLVASVMTQPLHLSEVRRGVSACMGVQDVPQVLLRFGYADTAPMPRTPRRPGSYGSSSEG
jgi:nitroreductase